MTRPIKLGISILAIAAGWFMMGFGYTTTVGHPVNTMLFASGLVLFAGGITAATTWGRKQ